MKKLHLLAAAAMVCAMTACSQEEPIGPEENGPGSETVMDTEGKYMAISISNAAASRAASDFAFIDGEDYENYIDADKIRFYFFDNDGNPFMMTGKNINGEEIQTNMIKPMNITANNVNNSPASVANAVLVLGKAAGQGYEGTMPSRIVCVANASEDMLKKYSNVTLSELEKVMHDAVTPGNAGTFVMTSSAYWNGSKKVFWSEIKGENIASTTDGATANPVQIYIERLAARVDVTSMPENGKVQDANGNVLVIDYMDWQGNKLVKVEGKSVIAVPTGWGINTAAKKSYGIKNVANFNADPDATHYFTNLSDWTVGVRSFWSQTTATDYTAEAIKPERFIPANLTFEAGDSKYIFGNTADPFLQGVKNKGIDSFRGKKNFARTYATKVLVGVKLYVVDKDATTYDEETDAINLMYWGGVYYTPEALAHSMADWEQTDMKVVCVRGNGNGDKNKSDKQHHFNVNFYKVAAGSEYDSKYGWGDVVPYSETQTPEQNSISKEPALYWNGMGYYILNISNNMFATNKDNAEMYGVMRNTVYQYKLTHFTGLGTPVTDPDAETDVENPASGETFVAAQLNVLTWRVVSHEVGLE